MKKLTIAAICLQIFFGAHMTAQTALADSNSNDWKLTTLGLSTGKTPLVNGVTAVASFAKGEEDEVSVMLNTDFGQVVYSKTFGNVKLSPTGGFYLNVPWAGPMINFSMFKGNLISTHWIGWSAGIPENRKTTLAVIPFMFSYQELRMYAGNWNFAYAVQHYQQNKADHILNIQKKFSLGKHKLSADISYVYPKKEFLWGMGVQF